MGKHKFSIQEKEYDVDVGFRRGNNVEVTVNGKVFEVELKSEASRLAIRSNPPPAAPAVAPVAAPRAAPTPRERASTAGGAGQVLAPMAGMVLSVKVKVGQQVAEGEELLVLEAMKMENAISAPAAGTVATVAVQPQQTVAQGELLIELS